MLPTLASPQGTSHSTVVEASVDDPRWSAFIDGHPTATVFHHPAWVRLLADYYGQRPFVALLLDEQGEPLAGLPVIETSNWLQGRRWVALPFTDYCPVVAANGYSSVLLDTLARRAQQEGVRGFELRAPAPGAAELGLVAGHVRHTLALTTDVQLLAQSIGKMHRRNIKKAERLGVEIRCGVGEEDIQVFYRLHVLTRKRLGVPVQPHSFVRLLQQRLLSQGMGFVLSAYVGGQAAASALFLGWNGVLIYKYGASDPRFWEYRPNNPLFWTAIRWAAERGYHTMDFGRTELENAGLREFKSGWGAQEEPLPYAVLGSSRSSSARRRLEGPMATVIRHSPVWVCRTLGQLLYRYAA